MTKLSLDIRKLVVQKLKDNSSQRKVAIDLNISRHVIQRIVLKFQQYETLENLPKSGRKPDNISRSERLLIRSSKGNPKKTVRELVMEWKSSHTSSVSTVKRILRSIGNRTDSSEETFIK